MSDTQPQDDIIDVDLKIIGDSKIEAPTQRRKLALRLLPYAALALVSAAGGGWLYRDLLAGYFPSDQVQELSKRVATFEAATSDNKKRVDAVVALTEEFQTKLSAAQVAAEKSTKQNADTAAQAQNSASDIASLKQDLEKISATSAELQNKLSSAAVSSTAVADPALTLRLAQLEKQVNTSAVASGASAAPDQTTNLQLLKTQIAGGQSFATALAPLARALPGAPGLDVLGAERAGLGNAATLATELDALRASLPKPQIQAEETGIWAGIKSLFSLLVRVKGVVGGDWATTAAKASAFAATGDLEQAGALFATANVDVDAAMPPALKAWGDKAKRRLKLEKALNSFAAALNAAGLAKE